MRPLSTFSALLAAILLLVTFSADVSGEQFRNPNDRVTWKQVQDLINTLKLRIAGRVKGSGAVNYPGLPGEMYDVGCTALCAYALVEAGEKPSSRRIKSMASYCTATIGSYPTTYNLACTALFLAAADPQKYAVTIQFCRQQLEKIQLGSGQWSYAASGKDPRNVPEIGDNSNTQFAILGLRACDDAGFAVSKKVWRKTREYLRSTQNSDGGWGYASWARQGSYGAMTAAAVASLWIIHEKLEGYDQHCETAWNSKTFNRGIEWIDKSFSPEKSRISQWHNYHLYAIERAGMVTARRYFNGYDWYRAGAAELVSNPNFSNISESAFALLFLSKGITPLIIQKLARSDDDWDNDHYDLQNLTEFYSEQVGNEVTWQNARVRQNAQDLLEAPLLLISGRKKLQLDSYDRKVLKEFLFNGGTILAIPASASASWADSFRSLLDDIFPEARLMNLPSEHEIYTHMFDIPPEERPDIFALFEGCSLKVVFIPDADLTCQWTTKDHSASAFKLGVNILSYIAGSADLKNRVDPVRFVPLSDLDKIKDEPVPRGAVVIGQLKHDGLWRPNQFDIYNLMDHLVSEAGVTAALMPQPVEMASDAIFNHPITFMTGQFKFSYDEKDTANIRKFLEKGGFLFAEPSCGQKAFDIAFRKFIADVLPEKKLKRIPMDNEIYTIGHDIRKVSFRPPVVKKHPDLDEPVLEGIMIDGRYAVVYTPFNFSIGLNGHHCPFCWGYSKEDSMKVAANIVLYALNN